MNYENDERAGLGSASSAERDVNCPGWRNLTRGLPSEAGSAVAASGTAIHKAWETGDDSALDEDEADIAAALKRVEDVESARWMQENSLDAVPAVLREERLWIRNRQTLEPLYSAQVDVAYVAKHNALIIDGKTGFKDATPSEINWQLRVQAIALWQEYPDLKRIRVAIAQGRFRPKFDPTDYELSDLLNAERDLLFHIWRTKQPDAPRVAGTWCRYCQGKAYCHEAATWAMVVAAQTREAVPTDKATAVLYASRLTPPQLAQIHARKTIIEAVLDAVNNRLKAMTDEQLAEIGLAKKPGAKKKEITDQAKARELLKAALTDEQINAASSISRSKAAEILHALTKCTKKEAGAQIDTILAPVLEEKQNSPSVVPL